MGEPAPNQLGQETRPQIQEQQREAARPHLTDAPPQPLPTETLNNLNTREGRRSGRVAPGSVGSVCEPQQEAGVCPAGSALGCLGLLQGCEVFEGSSPIVAGQVLVELILEGLQAVTVGGAGTEAGDVGARGVWQMDGEGLWQHQELILLRR